MNSKLESMDYKNKTKGMKLGYGEVGTGLGRVKERSSRYDQNILYEILK